MTVKVNGVLSVGVIVMDYLTLFRYNTCETHWMNYFTPHSIERRKHTVLNTLKHNTLGAVDCTSDS